SRTGRRGTAPTRRGCRSSRRRTPRSCAAAPARTPARPRPARRPRAWPRSRPSCGTSCGCAGRRCAWKGSWSGGSGGGPQGGGDVGELLEDVGHAVEDEADVVGHGAAGGETFVGVGRDHPAELVVGALAEAVDGTEGDADEQALEDALPPGGDVEPRPGPLAHRGR